MVPDRELGLIRDFIARREWASARDVASQAILAYPDHSELWFLLGASLHALGERTRALDAFRKTVELAPAFVPALNATAVVLAEENLLTEALDVIDRAIALVPSDASAWFNRGVVLERMTRWTDSLDAYDRTLALDNVFASARLNRGAVLMMLGRYENAVENNRRLVQLQPESADAHLSLAEALLGLGLSIEGLKVCDRALALDPRHAKGHIDRGLALSDLGRFVDAQAAFDSAEAISPGAIRDYLNAIAPTDPSLERVFDPRLVFLYRGYDRLTRCDWALRGLYIDRLTELVRKAEDPDPRHIDIPLAYHVLTVPAPSEVPLVISTTIGNRYAAAVAETGVSYCQMWCTRADQAAILRGA